MRIRGDLVSVDLRIGGMHCSACAARIEKSVGRMPGVRQAAVSYASRSAWVVYEPEQQSTESIQTVISKIGFQSATAGKASFDHQERRALLLRLVLSALLTLPLIWTMGHHVAWLSFLPVPDILMNKWLQLGLATLIQLVPAAPFYYGAYYALRQRSANMDVLVAIGTTAAYLYSHYMVFRGGGNDGTAPLYFETSAVVITAVLLGKWIEASAARRTAAELDGYGALQPTQATVMVGSESVDRLTTELRAGDQIRVEAGERFPADGLLVSESAEADESLLTGESRSVAKRRGERIYAGTLNLREAAVLTVQSAGDMTALHRLSAMMREALASKTSVQRKADRLAGIFVPIMLLLAAVTFFISYGWLTAGNAEAAFIRSLAVLLAACPCALGLATPLSLAAAAAFLSKRGIVFKQADALESLAKVRAVVFDKTGTLTEGRASIAAICSPSLHPAALLRMAAAAEAHATHPYAAAIREAAMKQHGMLQPHEQPAASQEESTGGVSISLSGSTVAVGGKQFAMEKGWTIGAAITMFAEEREKRGETVWYVAREGHCEGALALADRIRPDAAAVAAKLHSAGIHVALATGDRQAAAKAVGGLTRIADVRSALRSEQKVELIRSLQRKHKAVAMIGDGWNDAPAIAAADVGFAIGGGAEAAMGAGQIALVHGRLSGVTDAMTASRLTMNNVRQNITLAFLYNAAVIPSAALGKLEPWMAGTAMALSSLSVVGNSIRLRLQLRKSCE
ncbi:heavy metal translocating P-type ATPase [Paenibacillus curdlanolyticus YK9]|uniref:P-type Cu(+) transporter n=1 Tax=Paenibacillus curdlanolyticus YK9 TaxID=717606 RepID=E0I4E3_9BACL|nr:cation-translocating P-type ATPase [Paenibacillus curdlanolyticus]EFM13157.1 heavy metal translocating P-type ATPase [Paenibacillus curdlanolyticus YK9]